MNVFDSLHDDQAANLGEFCASMNPRFEGAIPDFINGIPVFMELQYNTIQIQIHFNVVHRMVNWRNPKLKSLNLMPDDP